MAENTADAGANKSYLSEGTRTTQRISSLDDTKKSSLTSEINPGDTVRILEEINTRRENGEFAPVNGQKGNEGREASTPAGEAKSPEIKTGPALWGNKDISQQIEVTGYWGKGPDGKDYVRAKFNGNDVVFPADEVTFVEKEAESGGAAQGENTDHRLGKMTDEAYANADKIVDKVVDKADWPTTKKEGEVGLEDLTEEIRKDPLYYGKYGKAILDAEERGETLDAKKRDELKLEALREYKQEKAALEKEGEKEREELLKSLNEDLDRKIADSKDGNEQAIYKILKERWQASDNSAEKIKEDLVMLKIGGPEYLITEWLKDVKDAEGNRVYADDQISKLLKNKSDKNLYRNVEYEAIPQLLLRRMVQPDFNPEEFSGVEDMPWAGEVKELLAQSVEGAGADDDGAGIEQDLAYQKEKKKEKEKNKEKTQDESELSWTALTRTVMKKLGLKELPKAIKLPVKALSWAKKNPDKTIKGAGVACLIYHAPFIISVPVAYYYINKFAKRNKG